jgi:hypothetical protein
VPGRHAPDSERICAVKLALGDRLARLFANLQQHQQQSEDASANDVTVGGQRLSSVAAVCVARQQTRLIQASFWLRFRSSVLCKLVAGSRKACNAVPHVLDVALQQCGYSRLVQGRRLFASQDSFRMTKKPRQTAKCAASISERW